MTTHDADTTTTSFDRSPMGYHNPSRLDGREAPFAVSGRDPDGLGGGIQFWAYSIAEANEAFDRYRGAGYLRVTIEPGFLHA